MLLESKNCWQDIKNYQIARWLFFDFFPFKNLMQGWIALLKYHTYHWSEFQITCFVLLDFCTDLPTVLMN
jgi:hypothetical protein